MVREGSAAASVATRSSTDEMFASKRVMLLLDALVREDRLMDRLEIEPA